MTCAHQQVGHWLAELSNLQGTNLNLDEEGYCSLASDDGLELTLVAEPSSEFFRVFVDIMPVPDKDPINIYQTCLRMNLDQGYTGGASVALDADSLSIFLSYMSSVESTSFTEFSNSLQNCLVLAEKIKADLIDADSKRKSGNDEMNLSVGGSDSVLMV